MATTAELVAMTQAEGQAQGAEVLGRDQPGCEAKHTRQLANQAADSILIDNALECCEDVVQKPPRKRSMPSRLQARLQGGKGGSGGAEEARKLKMEKMAARQALAEEKRREKSEAKAAKAR